MNVPDDAYKKIEKEISSADSPVGIDARHTHILIIHMLGEMQRRLDAIESAIHRLETR
ncbi:MAG: hypothetical protein ACOCSK_00145 [Rhodothermales bacterium]